MSDGTRTRDVLDHNQVLYQLSYTHRDPLAEALAESTGCRVATRSALPARQSVVECAVVRRVYEGSRRTTAHSAKREDLAVVDDVAGGGRSG